MNLLETHLREVVDKTWNAGNRCKTWDDHVWNAVSGLSGEVGEIMDIHKKMYFHKERDHRYDLLLEFGDTLFYLPKLIELHGFTVEECLAENKKKLFERYEIK